MKEFSVRGELRAMLAVSSVEQMGLPPVLVGGWRVLSMPFWITGGEWYTPVTGPIVVEVEPFAQTRPRL